MSKNWTSDLPPSKCQLIATSTFQFSRTKTLEPFPSLLCHIQQLIHEKILSLKFSDIWPLRSTSIATILVCAELGLVQEPAEFWKHSSNHITPLLKILHGSTFYSINIKVFAGFHGLVSPLLPLWWCLLQLSPSHTGLFRHGPIRAFLLAVLATWCTLDSGNPMDYSLTP